MDDQSPQVRRKVLLSLEVELQLLSLSLADNSVDTGNALTDNLAKIKAWSHKERKKTRDKMNTFEPT
jgi:hypothetical protein